MTSATKLTGNGAGLVRERALAARIQAALERMYRLDHVADVAEYVGSAEPTEREALLLREAEDGALEVRLRLPQLEDDMGLDTVCQIIEGVSHFVYVVDRAHAGREATQLELELQAEVDKWVVLATSLRSCDMDASAQLRSRLYERVAFAHAETTERGERYRVANDVANRFVRRLEREYLGSPRIGEMRAQLRRFFAFGQEEKLRLGRAA